MNLLLFVFYLCVSVDCLSAPSPTEIFQNLFAAKRKEQHAAVQQLMELDQERQDKLIGSMMGKMMDILLKGRTHLEAAGVGSMAETVPDAESTKNALALVLENTCFLSDIVLRFPDKMHNVFNGMKEWKTLFAWSLAFGAESPLLTGPAAAAKETLHLASQEMGVVPKEEGYHNPYRIERKKQKRYEDLPEPKKKEKKKLKKGPRMTKGEL